MHEIIKVAFVGTSCVGKSSLLSMCEDKIGTQIIPVSEAAREYFTVYPDIENRFSAAAQGEVQKRAFRKERIAHKQAHNLGAAAIICDRSVLDAPVYVSSQGDQAGAIELFNRAQPWLSTYNRIYLLDPTDVPFATDDVRDESEATRQLFHDTFLEFFARNGVGYELLSGDIIERFDTVNRYIGEVC